MRWETIRKDTPPRIAPNLGDDDEECAGFSWSEARARLEGLPGGRGLNIAHEAVDRHAASTRATAVALRCVGRDDSVTCVTYADLARSTARFANVLRTLGILRRLAAQGTRRRSRPGERRHQRGGRRPAYPAPPGRHHHRRLRRAHPPRRRHRRGMAHRQPCGGDLGTPHRAALLRPRRPRGAGMQRRSAHAVRAQAGGGRAAPGRRNRRRRTPRRRRPHADRFRRGGTTGGHREGGLR